MTWKPRKNSAKYRFTRNQEVAEQANYHCQYCGCYEPHGVLEHIISRSMGGHDEMYNLTYACWSCNSLKKKKVWVPVNIDAVTKDNQEWRDKILSIATTQGRSVSYLKAEKAIQNSKRNSMKIS
jgi:5-methylcytosine-specific restriction endonuclease McrA